MSVLNKTRKMKQHHFVLYSVQYVYTFISINSLSIYNNFAKSMVLRLFVIEETKVTKRLPSTLQQPGSTSGV